MAHWNRFDVRFDIGLQVWKVNEGGKAFSKLKHNSGVVYDPKYCYLILRGSFSKADQWIFELNAWIGKNTKDESLVRSLCDEFGPIVEEMCKSNDAKFVYNLQYQYQGSESESFKEFAFNLQKKNTVRPVNLSKQINLRDEKRLNFLYQIVGNHVVWVKIVELSSKSLNRGDAFVLDLNSTIYQWIGSKCNTIKKSKAFDLSVRLREERMNYVNAKIFNIKEGEEDDGFWSAMGGKVDYISNESVVSDEEMKKTILDSTRLYRVGHGGSLEIVDTSDEIPKMAHLTANGNYIFDFGEIIFAWLFRGSEAKWRNDAVDQAERLARESGRPPWVHVQQVLEGMETALFKVMVSGNYKEFIDNPEHHKERLNYLSNVTKTEKSYVNVDSMHFPEKYKFEKEVDYREEMMPFYDSTAKMAIRVWMICKEDKVLVSREEIGIFYSGQAYIVLLNIWMLGSECRNVLFYWLGRKCSERDKRVAAFLSIGMMNEEGRGIKDYSIIRVLQNKEPDYFLSYFQGYFTIRNGMRLEWADGVGGRSILFQLRNQGDQVKSVQVRTLSKFLNSYDIFLLHDLNGEVLCWVGEGATDVVRAVVSRGIPKKMVVHKRDEEMAESDEVCELTELFRSEEMVGVGFVEEGKEDGHFWNAINGNNGYCNEEYLKSFGLEKVKMFRFCENAGVITKDLMEKYDQDDLGSKEIFFLDAYHEAFLWVGSECEMNFEKQIQQILNEYIKTAQDGRSKSMPVYRVRQNKEPSKFIKFFHGWADESERNIEDYDILELLKGEDVSDASQDESKSVEGYDVVEYLKLKTRPVLGGIDPLNLEKYLSSTEFGDVFKMEYESYKKLPRWKQLQLKKLYGLF